MLERSLAALSLISIGCASTVPKIITLPTVANPFSASTLPREDVVAWSETILSRRWNGRAHFERAAFSAPRRRTIHLSTLARRLPVSSHRVAGPRTPDGTVALIHSHPRTSPAPSEQDVSEAHRLGVPIIVVTPDGLAMAMPSDERIVRDERAGARAARLH